jgi:Na+-transporting methylmalonyl-CoA/oxaloacetate decarboxylase gamma subunit
MAVDNVTFSITMIVVGMGGTLATLWLITFVINAMKKIFPADTIPKNK